MNSDSSPHAPLPHLQKRPQIHPTAFVHPTAVLIGDVRLGENVTILPMAVLRADINFIEVKAHSNIQDGSVVHVSDDHPVTIGEWVTVGHAAVIHACTIEEGVLIGMHATVLDGSVLGQESIVGAQTLVTKFTQAPSRSMILGVPGKIVRPVTDDEAKYTRHLSEKYIQIGRQLSNYRDIPH